MTLLWSLSTITRCLSLHLLRLNNINKTEFKQFSVAWNINTFLSSFSRFRREFLQNTFGNSYMESIFTLREFRPKETVYQIFTSVKEYIFTQSKWEEPEWIHWRWNLNWNDFGNPPEMIMMMINGKMIGGLFIWRPRTDKIIIIHFQTVFGCCKCNRSHFFSGNGKRNCSHINCFYVNPKPQCRCHNLLNWIKLILIVKCFHMLKRTLSAVGENETEQNDVKVHKMQPKIAECTQLSDLLST